MRPFKPIRTPVARTWYDVPVTYTVLVPVKHYDAETDEIEDAFDISEPRETTCRVLAQDPATDDGAREIYREITAKMKLVYSKKNKGQPELNKVVSIGAPVRTDFSPAPRSKFIRASPREVYS